MTTTKPDSLSDGEGGWMPTQVLIDTDTLQELISSAYISGCEAVQANYHPYRDPEFGEAAWDYVASLDFTETTRPVRAATSDLLEALKGVTQSTEWPTMERDTQDAVLAAIAKAEAPPPNLEGK